MSEDLDRCSWCGYEFTYDREGVREGIFWDGDDYACCCYDCYRAYNAPISPTKDKIMPEVGATYKHYKGGIYVVLHLAKHADDVSDQVVYRALKDDQVWVRTLAEWQTPVNGAPRFEKIPGNI